MGNKAALDLLHDIGNKITIALGKASRMNRLRPDDKDTLVLLLALNRTTELLKAMNNLFEDGIQAKDVDYIVETGEPYFRTLEKLYNVKITLDLESQRQQVHMDLDMTKMCSIVENIIENASKAGATTIHISDKCVEESVISTFSDNGSGSKNVDEIGSGFTTGGTGRGSQMIIQYMKDMGGTAAWKNNPNGGVEVTLVFKISKFLKSAA